MIARVLKVDVPADRIDALIDAYRKDVRPIHVRAAGLRQHYLLVNRKTGHVEIIGVWDTPDDVTRIAADLEPARQRLWAQFGADQRLEVLEVADELR